MEDDGLVSRTRSVHDGRRYETRLTHTGAIAADIADIVIREIESEIATYASRADGLGAQAVFDACLAINRPDRGFSH
jgi:DNA-binding MarR family transcriptional regulator